VIQAHVHFHGPIDRRGLPQDHSVELPSGSTIETLLQQLGYPDSQIRVIHAVIGGEKRALSHVVRDGERVEIFVVASGG
jgi:sulfur carrier protein ThiS